MGDCDLTWTEANFTLKLIYHSTPDLNFIIEAGDACWANITHY